MSKDKRMERAYGLAARFCAMAASDDYTTGEVALAVAMLSEAFAQYFALIEAVGYDMAMDMLEALGDKKADELLEEAERAMHDGD